MTPARGAPAASALTAFVVLLLVSALNLRTPITTVTAALDEVVTAYGLGGVSTAVLVALPVAVFALGAPVGPWLAARVGADRAIVLLSALLATAMVVRVFATWLLFLGTALAALAITGISILATAVFRRGSQHQAASLTSVFTGILTAAAAVGAFFALPVLARTGGSVPTALALWAVPAIVMAAALALTAPRAAGRPVVLRDPLPARTYLRLPAVWALISYFGLQSLVFYGVTAWLPSLLRERGLDPQAAAVGYVVVSLLGLLGTLTAPRLAVDTRRRTVVVVVVAVAATAGWLGLAYAPLSTHLLWAVLLGVAQGAGFALSLAFVVLRAETPAQAATLSALTQGVGYAIAAVGPLLMGVLLDRTGSWTLPIALLTAVAVAEGVIGVSAGRPHPVTSPGRNPAVSPAPPRPRPPAP